MIPTLSFNHKLNYGLGQFAWSAKDTCFHYFLFFYYTQMLGLAPGMAGLAALLALIMDGISDPIIGQMSDNHARGKWGRRHPFMMISVIPFCISLAAIFNPPPELSQMQLFCWYLVLAFAVRTSLTLFSVPHLALGAELSEDYVERTSIAVIRTFAGYCGGLGLQMAAWFFLIPMATQAGNLAEGYRNVGYLGAMMAFVGMIAAILGTRERIPLLVQTSSDQQSRRWYHAFHDILGLLGPSSSRILILASLLLATAVGLSNTLLLHINNFFYGFSSEQTGIFMLSILLSLIPASWMAMRGTRLLGKPRSVVAMLIVVALVGPIPVMSHLYGLTPATGSYALLAVVCACIVVNQSFYIAHLNTVGAMLPDIADEIELRSGLRHEGILNSALMLCQKLTFGVGTFLAGIALEFAGLENIASIEQVTLEMRTKLAWVYGPGLSVLVLAGAYIFSNYQLNEKKYWEIRDALEKARASASQ